MIPTVDICFKELMKNENVRRGFIAALMGVPPEKIRRTVLKDGTLPPEYGTDKLGLLDVKVILDNGVQIDIEMQVAFFAHWDARVLFYLSRMIYGQLGKGEAYGELKKCIHVGILFIFRKTGNGTILYFLWMKKPENDIRNCWRSGFWN